MLKIKSIMPTKANFTVFMMNYRKMARLKEKTLGNDS